MAPRRAWLVILAVASLVLLTYAGVFTAFSVPMGDGTRALVVPVASPTTVSTFARPQDEPAAGHNGSLLIVGNATSGFPSGTEDPRLVRALAYVTPTANGTYVPGELVLADVPHGDGTRNLTVNVTSLAGGRGGFLVKPDDGEDVAFVETRGVVGVVARFDSTVALGSMFAAGTVGFLAPLLALVLTHRAKGRVRFDPFTCRECRAPLEAGAAFCTRCGAYASGKDS